MADKQKSEGARIEANIPEGVSVSDVARRIANDDALILDRTVPKPKTMAELLRLEEEGWPSVLAMPSPGGAVDFPIIIRANAAVHERLQEVGAHYQERQEKYKERLGDLRKKLDAKGETENGSDLVEEIRTVAAEQPEILREWHAALFDTGIVAGWDAAAIGMECNKENFLKLCERGNGVLARGVQLRYRQLMKPVLEVLDTEGEDSSPAPDGSGEPPN